MSVIDWSGIPTLFPHAEAAGYGLSLLLKASAILGLAWIFSLALRRHPAGLRHVVWSVAFGAVLALPFISTWMPSVEVDLARFERVSERFFSGSERSNGSAVGMLMDASEVAAPPVESPVSRVDAEAAAGAGTEGPGRAVAVFLFVWLGGTVLLSFVLVAHLFRIRRVTKHAVAKPPIQALAAEIVKELEVHREPRVLVGEVEVPVMWGLIQPVVLLPLEAIDWDRNRLRLALMHEMAHIRRMDYLPHLMAELACIAYWPNPLVWLARRRLRAEQESACDDVVLRAGTASHDYAQLLLDIARSVQGRRGWLPGGVSMAEREGLKARIQSILDPEIDRDTVPLTAVLVVGLVVAVPALSAAALQSVDHNSVDHSEDAGTRSASASATPELESDRSENRSPGTELTLTLEAEDGRFTHPMAVHEDDLASGGRYVMVPDQKGHDPPDGGPGSATYHVDLEAGVRAVWARVIGDRHNDNSFFVSVDDGEAFRWDVLDPNERLVKEWTWLPVVDASGRAIGLEPGEHTLTFHNREDGTRLDAIFMTSEPGLIPHGRSPLPPPETSISVAFEAEEPTNIVAPMEIRADDEASGRLYVSVARGYNSRKRPPADGRARYRFEVPEAGPFVVWTRAQAHGNDADSFWIRANAGEWIRWNGIAHAKKWSWRLVHDSDQNDETVVLDLREGTNTIELAYREDGAKIDRFVVTNNMYVDPSTANASPSKVAVRFKE